MSKREIVIFAILALVGLALMVGGGGSDLYFRAICFPVMLFVTGIAGYLAPESYGLWGIAVVSLLPFACLNTGGGGPFVLVGVIVFGFLAVACWLSAKAGAALRRRRNDNQSD